MQQHHKLGDILVELGKLTKEQLENALKHQQHLKNEKKITFLGAILVKKGYVSQTDLYEVLEKQLPNERIKTQPWVLAAHYIGKAIGQSSYNEAVKKQRELGKQHVLAVLDHLGFMSYENQKEFCCDIFAPFHPDIGICNKISELRPTDTKDIYEHGSDIVKVGFMPDFTYSGKQLIVSYEEYSLLANTEHKDAADSLLTIKTGNAGFTINDLLNDAIAAKASDVHITFKKEPDGTTWYNTFFRAHGKLTRIEKYSMTAETAEMLLGTIKIMASNDTKGTFNSDEIRFVQDAVIVLNDHDLRLNFLPDGVLENTALTIRIQDRKTLSAADFKELGFFDEDVAILKKASRRQGGIIAISGKTNSGKSTLMAYTIAGIEGKKIVTIEDPIEYRQTNPFITQHQVYIPPEAKEDVTKKFGFLEFVKGVKRADTDIIVVGELRKDQELIDAIIEAAEAGQLILTTVHITSAFSIYAALEEVFKIPLYISAGKILYSKNLVMVDKLCPKCKKEDTAKTNCHQLKAHELELPYFVKGDISIVDTFTTYIKGDGCEYCNNKGYRGQTPIYEYFYPNVAMMEWVFKTRPTRFEVENFAIENKLGKNKLQTFINKLKEGVIDASSSNIEKIL